MSQSQPPDGPLSVAEFKGYLIGIAQKMSVEQLNEVLNRHHGAKARLAKQLDLTKTQISNTLNDKGISARVIEAARELVAELLALEASWKIT